MKGEIYQPGAPIKKEDLDFEKYSIQDSLSDRIVDLYSYGVLQNSQENAEPSPFKITDAGGLFIYVGSGVALASGLVDSSDPTTTGGERIHIPASDCNVGKTYQRSIGGGPGSGTGTGPFKESVDGLGGFVSTPESTLTRFVPVTNGATNYVWIGYLHAIDPTVYSLHKATSGKIYPRGQDGYDIIVTTSPTTPIVNGNANYLLLGTVLTGGGAVLTIDQSGMVFARTKAERVGIAINTSTPPTTCSNGQTKFLDDHINAMGTGPGPTVINPHNMSVVDLGVEFVDVDLVGHRRDHHTTGLIGSPLTSTSSLAPFTDPATPDPSPAVAMVFLKKLISGESLVISGNVYTSVSPALTGPIGAGATGDAYVSFLNTDGAGTYYIYIQVLGGVATVLHNTAAPGSTTYLIGTVSWNGSAFTSSVNDSRLFGLTGNKDIQASAVTTEKINDLAVTTPKIGLSAVTAANMASNSVATTSIQALAVANSNLGNLSVSTGKLQDASVTNIKMASNSIDTPNIINLAVTEAKLANGSVSNSKIQDASVTSAKLDISLVGAFVPTGGIISFGAPEGLVPAGWVVCDGRSLNGALPENSALFGVIGTTWGGAGYIFNVPDFRGLFLRMVNTTSSGSATTPFFDPDEGSRTKRDAISPATGVGSYQQDAFQGHIHSMGSTQNLNPGGNGSINTTGTGFNTSDPIVDSHANGTPRTSSESRAKNAYIVYIIKL